nr:O-antigen translocase [Parvibaculum indicum]
MRSSSIMGAASMLNILSGLVKMKVAALLLGPAGVGLIGIYQNLMQTASTVSALGFNNIGTRQVASASAAGEDDALLLVRQALLWGTVGLALIGAGVVWLTSPWIARRILDDPGAAGDVAWLGLGVALTVAAGSQTAYLTGLRRIGDVARVNVLSGVAAATLGILAIWLWGHPGVLVLVLMVPTTGFLAGHWFVSRLEQPAGRQPTAAELAGEWRKLALLGAAFMLSALAMTVAQLAVRSLVQHRLGVDALGQFQASWSIGMIYLTLILGAMATDYYPRLAGAIADHASAARIVNEQTEVALLLIGPVLLAMLSLAPWVIHLLYSAEFATASGILRWQILGDILKVVTWPLGFVVLSMGAGRVFILSQSLGALAMVGVTWAALPLMGVTATGVAFIAMYAVILPINFVAARVWLAFRWTPTVLIQVCVLTLAAVLVTVLARRSDMLAAAVGVPLSLGFGIHALTRLAKMAGLGGRVGKIAEASNRFFKRIGLVR